LASLAKKSDDHPNS